MTLIKRVCYPRLKSVTVTRSIHWADLSIHISLLSRLHGSNTVSERTSLRSELSDLLICVLLRVYNGLHFPVTGRIADSDSLALSYL